MQFESVIQEFGSRIGLDGLHAEGGDTVRLMLDETAVLTIERCQPSSMRPSFGVSISIGKQFEPHQVDEAALHEGALRRIHYDNQHPYQLSCGKTGRGLFVLSVMHKEEQCTIDVLEHTIMYLDSMHTELAAEHSL